MSLNKPDRNTELMKQMGSKTGRYDIEPPDQYLYNLYNGETALIKFQAWVKSKTTAYGHMMPYCIDEHGKTLHIENAASDLGWKKQTARNVLNAARKAGIVSTDDQRRIWQSADVPSAHPSCPKPKSQPNPVRSSFSSYLTDFIENLPQEKRSAAKGKIDSCEKWRKNFIADGMAMLRSIADGIEDTTYREIGIPKKRLPKRRPIESKYIQLSLLSPPDFVQSYSGDSVQSQESTSYKPENGSVQTAAGAWSLPTTVTATATAEEAGRQTSTCAEPPARLLEGWQEQIRLFLLNRPVNTPLTDLMLDRILAPLTAETAELFIVEAAWVKNPKKWPIYEAVAKQVAARWREQQKLTPKPPTKEEKAILDARQVLAHPELYDEESRQWARGVLGQAAS